MNILQIFEGYVPKQNAGAETTLHTINKYLIKHEDAKIDVYCPNYQDYTIDKVNVIGTLIHKDMSQYDLIFTHLRQSGRALNLSIAFKKPLVYFTHNNYTNYNMVVKNKGIYVVHNAKWSIKDQQLDKHPSIVVNPPTFIQDYIIKGRRKQEYITLVNMNENKGGKIIAEIAAKMPNRKFMGVIGAYGDQMTSNIPDNLELIETQDDITKVLRNTQILLMPSFYESWGKVGIEAMVSGIPVIANPTEGLKESLGEAGIFVDRNDIGAWVRAIESLDDPNTLNKQQELCKLRAKELAPEPQLDRLRDFLHNILNDQWKHNL